MAVHFTSRKRSTRLHLRLTRQPPLRGGRRSRNSFSPGFAFGSPASRRCAAGAARRTRFHPASLSAHLPAAAARWAPLADLVFTRVRLRLTCKPPLRGGRRSPNSFFNKYFPRVLYSLVLLFRFFLIPYFYFYLYRISIFSNLTKKLGYVPTSD